MSEKSVNLDSDTFTSLIECLSIMQEDCNDIDIKEGMIRQRSNDRSVIYEIDLTSILDDISISITGLKTKLNLFKMFVDNEVTLKINDTKFYVSDTMSTLAFEKPSEEFLDNKFIKQDELDKMFDLNEEDKILDTNIPATISDRLRVIKGVFNIGTLQILFEGDKASLNATSKAKDQHAKLIENIVLSKEFEKSTTSLVMSPFIFEHDDNIVFSLYLDEKNNLVISKSKGDIGEASITVFSRSNLKEVE